MTGTHERHDHGGHRHVDEHAVTTVESVEAAVRREIAKALGGKRGVLEAAVPTLLFTGTWLSTRQLPWALGVSIVAAVLALLVRLVQRSTVRFAVNALLGIGIGWFFVHLSASRGGDANDQALAYFLPGLLYNSAYTVGLTLSNLVNWPIMGFVVGSVSGDPTAWRQDPQVVALCRRLTWLLMVPCLLRVIVQWPLWLAGHYEVLAPATAIGLLGVLKIAMGWPLQLASFAAMAWILARDRTPAAPQPS